MTMDPLGLIEDLASATDRLLADIRTMAAHDVAEASLLPGWTRGHVLTHLARNADGAVNLLTWAQTGVETPQYESLERRAADIEAGAGRKLDAQVEDVATTAQRLAKAAAAMPAMAWTATVRWANGAQAPAARVIWSRLREVEIHHVDLGVGYLPRDWPEAFAVRLVRSLMKEAIDRTGMPRFVLRCPEIGHDLAVGDPAGPTVTGPAWAAAAWLVNRDHADVLRSPDALPELPPWA